MRLTTAILALLIVGQLPPDTRAVLERLVDLGQQAQRLLVTTVPATGDLQKALDAGGTIELAAGATYSGPGFRLRSGTTLRGNGATVIGTTAPALYVPPGVSDVRLERLTAASSYAVVIQLGDNDVTQTTADRIPQRIVLSDVTVASHRGKRAIEVNAAATLQRVTVADTWDPAGRDSQAIAILNTCGPVTVEDSTLSAGSEPLLVGGDVMKVPCIPSDITVTRTRIWRPLTWRTDGVKRVVKNGLELKTGNRVRVSDLTIEGVWKDGQDGYGIVLTPRSGGAITDAVFERVTMRDVSAGFQVTGHNIAGELPTPARTTGIVVRNSTIRTNKAVLGGRGLLALLGMGPDTIDFERVTFIGDGTQLVYIGDTERVGRVRFIDGLATVGSYGVQGPTGANAANWPAWCDLLDVRGNRFSGATSAFQKKLSSNTWVTRAELDVLVQ